MPTYEFECRKCRHITTVYCPASERDKLPKCEKCGHHKLDRVISPVPHTYKNGVVRKEFGASKE